jgi:competence protein ComEC
MLFFNHQIFVNFSMLNWTPYVMVRIALFFIAGILLAIYIPELIDQHLALAGLLALIPLYYAGFIFFRNRNVIRVFTGLCGLVAVFIFGYFHLLKSTGSNSEDHLLSVKDPIHYYEAIVRSAPESKSKSWRIEVEVTRVKTHDWIDKKGKVLLYISKKSIDEIPWQYGDRLLIKGNPGELKPPANPYEFDFKRFLGFKNIYHQQFVYADQILKTGEAERKGFIYYSLKARAWSSSTLNQYIDGEQEQAIAAALVLGVTEGIDTDLQNAYAASGAMHVLAVSGLHVGIIYAILLFLLRPMNRFAWSRWVVFFISIICLWSFAFVTGLSPSVLRAVTMFSFIALARPLGWRTNIYNTLAGSAFLLLLFNPYLIMSVGFQLSYLAVLGIVYLQRPLYNLWEIENRIGDWIWQITCVSIAAQISTFALGMLYFHQFPVYFLVSNLFVIPLSTAILVIGIFLLVISAWTSAAWLTGLVITWLIKALNWIVFYVEDLPFSLIEEIHLTTVQCWIIMILMLSLIFTIEYKSIRWLYFAGVFSIMLIATQWIHFRDSIDRHQFVVYSVNGFSAMEWIDNGQSYFLGDSTLAKDQDRIRFHIRPNRLNSGVAETHSQFPFQKEIENGVRVAQWNGNAIAFIEHKNYSLSELAEIDYLVIGKNSVRTSKIDKPLNVKKVILDGSNSRWYINQWKAICEKQNISFHPVLDEGAFVLTE